MNINLVSKIYIIFKFDDYLKAWKAVLIVGGTYYRHYRIIESLDFLGLYLNCCILILFHVFLIMIRKIHLP